MDPSCGNPGNGINANTMICFRMLVGERGFEPPTPWSRKRDSGVVLNVFNLLQWCFDRLSPARSLHSGVNVSPRMAVPDHGFTHWQWRDGPLSLDGAAGSENHMFGNNRHLY